MNGYLAIALRMAPPFLTRWVNRTTFFLFFSIGFFAVSLVGNLLPSSIIGILFSFCIGQAIFILSRLVAFCAAVMLAAVSLAVTGKEKSPPSWDVYFEKVLLACDIAIVLKLSFGHSLDSYVTGIVSWALVSNYILNVLFRIYARMSYSEARVSFYVDLMGFFALPTSAFFALLSCTAALCLFPSTMKWSSSTKSFEEFVTYPLLFHAAGWYYLMQLVPEGMSVFVNRIASSKRFGKEDDRLESEANDVTEDSA